jgi:SIR2-like domain
LPENGVQTDSLLAELRTLLDRGEVVPVVGAGVSIATAGLPNWSDLIRSAIRHVALRRTCDSAQIDAVTTLLDRNELPAAAEKACRLLGAPAGEFPAWLATQFNVANEQIKSTDLINSIIDLPCPVIATTNYDRLLSQLHPNNPIALSWRDPIKMQAALRDKEPRIFHLHGIYDDPDSIVLGVAEYETLVAAPAYRAVLEALWLTRTLLFVGCSFDGLADPDFCKLLTWASATFKGSPYRHYAILHRDSFRTEDVRKYLHDWRIQIVPYGPTHDSLPASVRAINPQRERALAVRAHRAQQIFSAHDPNESARFAQLLESISAAKGPVSSDFQAEARQLFERQSKGINRMRGDLISLQKLMAGIVDPGIVRRHLLERKWDRQGQPPEYKEVVIRAHAALSLIRPDLLSALTRRRVDIHERVLDGYCSAVVKSLAEGSEAITMIPYEFENTQRVLSTLLAILDADPDVVFPKLRAGSLLTTLEDPLLLVGWDHRLELRSVRPPYRVLADLPFQTTLQSAFVGAFRGATAVICANSESVFAWDPRRSPTALASFFVSTPYGIDSVVMKDKSSPLELIAATIDGEIIWLEDFKSVRWRTVPRGSFFDNLVVVEGRIFARKDFEPGVYEIFPTGQPKLRFSRSDVTQAALRVPGLRARLSKAIDQLAADLELDSGRARAMAHDDLLAWPRLSRQRLYDVDVIAVHVRLDILPESDSMLLFLRPSGEALRPIGYLHIPDRILQAYQILPDPNGTPCVIGAVAPAGEEPFDLVVRYRGVATPQGVLFAPDGSLLRHETDIVRIAMFDTDRGFVCDYRGVPFEVCFAAGSVSRLELELETRPTLFNFVTL